MNTSSKLKRFREREAWSELQIIINGYRALGFDYLITRQPLAKLCFGSATDREVLPISGRNMSPLMHRVLFKTIPVVSPTNAIIQIENKSASKDGNVPFLSKVARFQYPIGNGTKLYHPNDHQKSFQQNLVPFGMTRFRKTVQNTNQIVSHRLPGPGTYAIDRKRKNLFKSSFGHRRRAIPASRTLCTPKSTAICINCGQQPKGDYWQNWNSIDNEILCRLCMDIERKQAKAYKSKFKCFKRLEYLNQFERVRYCGYCHEHNGTTASIKLWNKNDLRKKFRCENYMAMFEI